MTAALGFIRRYQLLDLIGKGGMGVLYLARDPGLDRLIAIKLLRDGFDSDELRARFVREAKALARLTHQNIVTVFEVGEHDGRPFIAMEYVPGETLRVKIRRLEPMSVTLRLQYLEDLCAGLDHAHKASIIHRDVKPSNLMITPQGALKILDFGIARWTDSNVTQSGMLVGTLPYMSPEQLRGEPVDHRSDIFSVGAVAYELMSYRQAFPGEFKDGIFHRITTVAPAPLQEVRPGLDPRIIALVNKALEKEPAKRYQDLVAMRKDLAHIRLRLETQAADPAGALSRDNAFHDIAPPPISPSRGTDRELIARKGIIEARTELQRGDLTMASEIIDRVISLNTATYDTDIREQMETIRFEIEGARQRSRTIRLAMDRAQQHFNEGALDLALLDLDEVLALDPKHDGAKALKDRVVEAIDVRGIEQMRQLVEAARRRFADGDHEGAIAMLADVQAPSENVTRCLVELRAKAQELETRRRVDEERRALEDTEDVRNALEIEAEILDHTPSLRLGETAFVDRWKWMLTGTIALAVALIVSGDARRVQTKTGVATGGLLAPTSSGTLVLDALPWAVVSEIVDANGQQQVIQPLLYTPAAMSVPAGDYKVTFTDPVSSTTRSVTVQVTASERGRAFVEFEKIDVDEYFRRAGWPGAR